MFPALTEIAERVDHILNRGSRIEVLGLLAFLAGRSAVAKIRAAELREQIAAPSRDLTVKEAAQQYPISRSFLYEHGLALGIVHKTPQGKVIVKEQSLRKYLEGE